MAFWSILLILLTANLLCGNPQDQIRNLKKPTTKFYYYWKSDKAYNDPPDKFGYYKWQNEMVIRHVINLTNELFIDMEQKFRETTKFMSSHKDSPKYVMGMLASNIRERFKKMLKTYRQYANYSDLVLNFKQNKEITKYIDGYMEIDGDYNELCLYHDLFVDALKKNQIESKKSIKFNLDVLGQHLEKGMSKIRKIVETTTTRASKFDFNPDNYDEDQKEEYKEFLEEQKKKNENKNAKQEKEEEEKNATNQTDGGNPRRYKDVVSNIPTMLTTKKSTRQIPDTQIDDTEYKNNLRQKAWEKKYGHFNPNLEGIDVNLDDF